MFLSVASLRASSPIRASEASLARTRAARSENGQGFLGSGARFSKVPIIKGHGKLLPFTLKVEVSMVLHLT